MPARFFLGTHEPSWVYSIGVPIFLSYHRIGRLAKRQEGAAGPWAIDSGGFTELNKHGRWTVPARRYAVDVEALSDRLGCLEWAACQDWMCEPVVREKTGLTVEEHQRRTIDSYLELRAIAPGLPWVPVLQGWEVRDYHTHVEMYDRAGVDLRDLPLVGIGSVCRRQHTPEVEGLIREISATSIRLHGFGFKIRGLARVADALTSADSLAWSFDARRAAPLEGCPHKNCANCRRYALRWREHVVGLIARSANPN